MVATAMTGSTRASAGSFFFVLLFVALAGAGVADLASAATGAGATVAFSGDDNNNVAALLTTPASASPAELNGFMQCLLGCFTQVFGCSFGCMGKKGADLPLCIISCDQKSVVCMIRCGLSPSPSPSPPKPSPPGPKPPSPKPPSPKPPKPPTPKPPTPKPPKPSPPTPAPPGPPYPGPPTPTPPGPPYPDPPTPAPPGPPYTPPYAVTGRKTAASA
ncbi:actin cytoskeleton-regulatory complex protein PAN1-like [Miscanthus floridulus]|uniref:actin cytoskeleton-regulatory complex protein PAN1-like n=1 Tax=Miscanthus floridulus TaxID=154761 RepID=UPI003459CE72